MCSRQAPSRVRRHLTRLPGSAPPALDPGSGARRRADRASQAHAGYHGNSCLASIVTGGSVKPHALASILFAGFVCQSSAAAQQLTEYRVLATSKTSTMQKEMQEAAAAGFRFA